MLNLISLKNASSPLLTPMLTNLWEKDVLYILTYVQQVLVWSSDPLCQAAAAAGKKKEGLTTAGKAWEQCCHPQTHYVPSVVSAPSSPL